MLSFDIKPVSSNPLLYRASFRYGQPSVEGTSVAPGAGGTGTATPTPGGTPVVPNYTGLPANYWEGGSGTASMGATDVPHGPNGNPLPATNTAGVQISGIAYEESRLTLTYHEHFADTSFLPDLLTYTNAIANDNWLGTPPRTWLCKGATWSPETQTEGGQSLRYYRVSWSFEYRPLPGWVLRVASNGYQEIKGGKLVDILNGDDPPKPTTEPRGLDVNGAAASRPHTIDFYPHPELAFAGRFGSTIF